MNHIVIRSSDRHSSSSSSANARFMLHPGIRFGEAKRLKLEYAQVYNTVYNIQADVNNNISLAENKGAILTGSLNPGYYNGETFAIEIARVLSALSPTSAVYTVSYSPTTFKLTISSTIHFTISTLIGDYLCWKEMGMCSAGGLSPVDGTLGLTYTCPFPVTLNAPLSWYVTINEFGTDLTASNMEKYSLYLPMTVGAGGVMEYNRLYMSQYLHATAPLITSFTVQWQTITAGATEPLSLMNSDWELVFSYE